MCISGKYWGHFKLTFYGSSNRDIHSLNSQDNYVLQIFLLKSKRGSLALKNTLFCFVLI